MGVGARRARLRRAARRRRDRRRRPARRHRAPRARDRRRRDRAPPVDAAAIAAALDGADLVDRRQPLLAAAQHRRRARGRTRRRASTTAASCFRHHDLPWQRRAPRAPREPSSRRASTARCTRRSTCAAGASCEARGYAGRDDDPQLLRSRPAARRPRPRPATQFGFGDDELVVLQPSRAIERKNVPGARAVRGRTCARRDARPSGSAVGRGPGRRRLRPTRSTRIVERADVPVTRRPRRDGRRRVRGVRRSSCSRRPGRDSAIPSIESIAAPARLRGVPVPGARRDRRGRRALLLDRAARGARAVPRRTEPRRETYFDVNLRRARLSFSLADLPAAIDAGVRRARWIS